MSLGANRARTKKKGGFGRRSARLTVVTPTTDGIKVTGDPSRQNEGKKIQVRSGQKKPRKRMGSAATVDKEGSITHIIEGCVRGHARGEIGQARTGSLPAK